MKVLVTLDFPPESGGIQRYLHEIVSHTFAVGDRVLVGCSGRQPRMGAGAGATVSYLSTPLSRFNKKWSLLPLTVRLAFLRLAAGNALQVQCGNVFAAAAPWFLARLMRLPYSVYVHGTEIAGIGGAGAWNRVLRSVLAHADGIFANSNFTASLVASLRLRPLLTVLSPKISFDTTQHPGQATPAQTGDGAHKARILCVGRQVPHKGHHLLIQAVSMLSPTLDWRLVLIGDGPRRNVLTRMAFQLNVQDRTEFEAGVSDEALKKEYASATMFVLPSTTEGGVEGFGIVLLEAMAAQLPIIATDTGGIPEVLDQGKCGILVPQNDAHALAAAIERLATDPALRRNLVRAAGERLQRYYVWP
jgi:glycosyltransferase involved in cell wall biosynthesis